MKTIKGAPVISKNEFEATRNYKRLRETLALSNNVRVCEWGKDADGKRTLRFIGSVFVAVNMAAHGYTVRQVGWNAWEIVCSRIGARIIEGDLDANEERRAWAWSMHRVIDAGGAI